MRKRLSILVLTFALVMGIVGMLALISEVEAQGQIVVGVPSEMYDTVVAGVEGWNAAGLGFVVEATGCGTGDVTFCWQEMDPNIVAWYEFYGNTILVNTVSPYPFSPAVVCHELGHWLGLLYHTSDYSGCMADPIPTSVYPNEAELNNLGLSWNSVSAPEVESAPAAPVVTELPKTGMQPYVGPRP